MNLNSITNSQENEIDKILQDGIDKSLLYIQSLNTSNPNEIPKYSTVPLHKSKTRTHPNKKNSTFNKKRTLSKNKNTNNNSKKTIRPLSVTHKNIKIQSLKNTKILPKYQSTNKIKKRNILDYQLEYNKKKEELEKYKSQLIQERIKQNKLQKEMNSKIKKEEEFKQIEENNKNIKNNTEELILKIQRSEKIREEQSKIIDGLLKQYNSMIKELRNNPNVEIINKYRELEYEAENLKKEGNAKNSKKKGKKRSNKNF